MQMETPAAVEDAVAGRADGAMSCSCLRCRSASAAGKWEASSAAIHCIARCLKRVSEVEVLG